MKIKILTSHPSFKIDRQFTEKETKFILFLEEDFLLEDTLQHVRKIVGIPDNGLDIFTEMDKYGNLSDNQYKNILKHAYYLMLNFKNENYRLPKYWLRFFRDLIIFNVAIPPGLPVEIKQEDEKLIITINESITREELDRFLYEKRDKVDPVLKQLPKFPTIKIKLEKIKLMKNVLEKKKSDNNGKVETDENIAGKMEDEEGWIDDNSNIQGSSLGSLRSRFEKDMRKVLQLKQRIEMNRLIQEELKKRKFSLPYSQD